MSLLKKGWKELSFWHKFWFSNPYIFATWWCIQTIIMWSNRIQSLKYLRSPTLNCKAIGIRKSGVVAKTQFLYNIIAIWGLWKENLMLSFLFLANISLEVCWVVGIASSLFLANISPEVCWVVGVVSSLFLANISPEVCLVVGVVSSLFFANISPEVCWVVGVVSGPTLRFYLIIYKVSHIQI